MDRIDDWRQVAWKGSMRFLDIIYTESRAIDTALISLSSGALVLTAQALRGFDHRPSSICVLVAAWISLGMTIILILVGKYLAIQEARYSNQNILIYLKRGEPTLPPEREGTSRIAGWSEGLTILAFAAFVIGIVLVAVFQYYNLPI